VQNTLKEKSGRMNQNLERAIELFCKLTDNTRGCLEGKSYIDGRWIDNRQMARWFDVTNPATGEMIGYCHETPKVFIDKAFREARRAQFRWRYLVSPQDKRRVFERLEALLKQWRTELAYLFSYESGKVLSNSIGDIIESEDTVQAAHNTLHDNDGTVEEAQLCNKFAGTIPWEHGIELAMKPFNFIAIYFWKVAASVMSGSAVVLKEAEQIPYSAMCMTALVHQALRDVLGQEQAQKLAALVQLLQGQGETVGEYAVENGDYDFISVTGSRRMGTEVTAKAASKLRPQHAELSGHNRVLMWFDYPIEKAADEIVLGAFGDSGQRCVSTRAVFIPDALFDTTLSAVIERAKKLKIGDPLDPETQLGPIISREQLTAIEQSVSAISCNPIMGGYALNPSTLDRARAEGFNFNPEDFRKGGKLAQGYWWVPTVFVRVPHYHDIMRYEVFGPVVVLQELERAYDERAHYQGPNVNADFWIDEYIKARKLEKLPDIKKFLQGVALVNDNLFGLSSACLSYDMRYALHFLTLAQTGLRYIGRGTTGAEVDDNTIFGGGKNSGWGREGGSVRHARRKAQFYIDFHPCTRLAQQDE